jgi:hypothetical protein
LGKQARNHSFHKLFGAELPANLTHQKVGIRFLEVFLCSGSSALLLSSSKLYPEFWFFSLIALIPFLWRIKKASLAGAAVSGIVLGGCYAFAVFADEALFDPWTFLYKLFFLSLIFAIFGIAINRINKSPFCLSLQGLAF